MRTRLIEFLAACVRRSPRIARLIRRLARSSDPDSVVLLEYPVRARPRWDQANPHPELYQLFHGQREQFRQQLTSFLAFGEALGRIQSDSNAATPMEPHWRNHWFPALDALSTYCLIAQSRPRQFIEVGSGNSTKFARRAVTDHALATRITSIDPSPRAEIDVICDRVIRQRAEDVDPEVFAVLDKGDILFIDSSHRALMNSDVTALFLEVLPRLRPGVLVHIHDIALPFDYPPDWGPHFFSEQYLLAAYLLGGGSRFDVVLPNAFIRSQPDLHGVLAPLRQQQSLKDDALDGMSFWLRTR
jgi:hypothetical protein